MCRCQRPQACVYSGTLRDQTSLCRLSQPIIQSCCTFSPCSSFRVYMYTYICSYLDPVLWLPSGGNWLTCSFATCSPRGEHAVMLLFFGWYRILWAASVRYGVPCETWTRPILSCFSFNPAAPRALSPRSRPHVFTTVKRAEKLKVIVKKIYLICSPGYPLIVKSVGFHVLSGVRFSNIKEIESWDDMRRVFKTLFLS